ncbi:MAG: hypothetical protein JOZ39_00330 [Chloroflexi bacterium]|nr:hypothetical protein [Chloroflexota bacterium]
MSIASIDNLQLNVLQLPEVAREEVPILAQAQLANAQTSAIVDRADREATEMVQTLPEAGSNVVPNSLAGMTARQRPSYHPAARRPERLQRKVIALAAAHPFGVGKLVDFRA